jgi:hypothetical protein
VKDGRSVLDWEGVMHNKVDDGEMFRRSGRW